MLQTKGIETTTRELDFPCFLQNKYLFATKAAGRMRRTFDTTGLCVCASWSRGMIIHWVLSKVRLSSISPNLWITVFSYLCKTERKKAQGVQQESPASGKQNKQWGCLLELLCTPNSSIISSGAIVGQPHVLPFGVGSKGTTLVQRYLCRGPSSAGSSQPFFEEEISRSSKKESQWRWALWSTRTAPTSGCWLWKNPCIS